MGKQKRSEKFYLFSVLWGTISSLVILYIIKSGIKNSDIFSIKDLAVYLYAVFFYSIWLNRKSHINNIGQIIFFLIVLFANYFWLSGEYSSPLKNIRQIIAPLILLSIYTGIVLTEESAAKIVIYLCYISLFVFAFGVLEQVFQLWEKINLSDFFRLKNIPVNEHGVSYMFYEPMFGNRERMTSVLLDPISLGHFYATFGSYLFYLKDKSRLQKTAFFTCLISLLLCLSKGAILQIIICIFFFNKKISALLKLLGIVIFCFILKKILYQIEIGGILIHILGFTNSIRTVTCFGHGIGSAGNYSAMFSEQSLALGIGDTYIGSLIGQTGIFGTLFWIIVAVTIMCSSHSYKISKQIAIKIFFSIFLISILSENTMNVTSFLLPCIIIGLCLNTDKKYFKQ
jgi:hypothetical protein